MNTLAFHSTGDGGFKVSGRLGFDSVDTIWESSRIGLTGADQPRVDLGEVTHVDSAGLALVLEWVGLARSQGKRLQLTRVPAKLMDLARISEVDAFLAEPVKVS